MIRVLYMFVCVVCVGACAPDPTINNTPDGVGGCASDNQCSSILPTPYGGQWDMCVTSSDCQQGMVCDFTYDSVGRCRGLLCATDSDCPPTNECATTWCNTNYAQPFCVELDSGDGNTCTDGVTWCTKVLAANQWYGSWQCCSEAPRCIVPQNQNKDCNNDASACGVDRTCIDNLCCVP